MEVDCSQEEVEQWPFAGIAEGKVGLAGQNLLVVIGGHMGRRMRVVAAVGGTWVLERTAGVVAVADTEAEEGIEAEGPVDLAAHIEEHIEECVVEHDEAAAMSYRRLEHLGVLWVV